MVKSYRPLQKAFRAQNMSVREWIPLVGFPRSRQTVNNIVAGENVVEPTSFVYMAHCLDFKNEKIIALLHEYNKESPDTAAEVKILIKLISPLKVTTKEQKMLERLRSLPANKRKVIFDILAISEG